MNKKQHLSNIAKNSPAKSSAKSPWLLMKRDSKVLILLARDVSQLEETRITALEILGRRTDKLIESKLALLSKKDKNPVIQNAACRALHRSRYTRISSVSSMLGGKI